MVKQELTTKDAAWLSRTTKAIARGCFAWNKYRFGGYYYGRYIYTKSTTKKYGYLSAELRAPHIGQFGVVILKDFEHGNTDCFDFYN